MDNSGAINLANDPVSPAKSKHIHLRELKICKLVADGTMKLKYVKSEDSQHKGGHLHRTTWPRRFEEVPRHPVWPSQLG
eukprot:5107243-Pleurochrysis_carterae.AAC.1